ncbi:hypothetical protein K431DRAFT_299468 [Polychaeton citri CBS 116435]|uniref:Uncharacterized protein n=1 Tax=Polychaeton citri CBS 116435 TaxID=1314669 RepID=A0A9P4QIV6_9PEZI|nr:hypothetical protein K431DRAFT_299468 [Polychaeton citri CBS 116435]
MFQEGERQGEAKGKKRPRRRERSSEGGGRGGRMGTEAPSTPAEAKIAFRLASEDSSLPGSSEITQTAIFAPPGEQRQAWQSEPPRPLQRAADQGCESSPLPDAADTEPKELIRPSCPEDAITTKAPLICRIDSDPAAPLQPTLDDMHPMRPADMSIFAAAIQPRLKKQNLLPGTGHTRLPQQGDEGCPDTSRLSSPAPSASSMSSGYSNMSSQSSFAYFIRESRSDLRLYHKRSKPSQHLREAVPKPDHSVDYPASSYEPRVVEDSAAILAPPPPPRPKFSHDYVPGKPVDRPRLQRFSAYYDLASRAARAPGLSGLRRTKSTSQTQLSCKSLDPHKRSEDDRVTETPITHNQLPLYDPMPTPPEVEPGRSFKSEPCQNLGPPHLPEGPDRYKDVERQSTIRWTTPDEIASKRLSCVGTSSAEDVSDREANPKKRKRQSLLSILEDAFSSTSGKLETSASVIMPGSLGITDTNPPEEKMYKHSKSDDTLRTYFTPHVSRTPGARRSSPSLEGPGLAGDEENPQPCHVSHNSGASSECRVSLRTTWTKTGRVGDILTTSQSAGAVISPKQSADQAATSQSQIAADPTFQLADGKICYKSSSGMLNSLPVEVGRKGSEPEVAPAEMQSTEVRDINRGTQTQTYDFNSKRASNVSDSPTPYPLTRRFAIPYKKSWSRLLQQPLQLKKVKSVPSLFSRKRKDPLEVTEFHQTPYRQRYSDALRVEQNHIKALMRHPDIMNDDDGCEGESLLPFDLDVPDHLPNSPLCPLSSKHRYGEKWICPLHRRRRACPPKGRGSLRPHK